MQCISNGKSGSALFHSQGKIGGASISAAGNDRHLDPGCDSAHEIHIEALARTLLVYGGQHDLPSTQHNGPFNPLDHVQSGMFAPVVGKRFPPTSIRSALGFHG